MKTYYDPATNSYGIEPVNPLSPAPTWARPRNKRAARTVDRLADAIDAHERAAAKLKRAARAWIKAGEVVDRLNKRVTRDNMEG